MKNIIPLIIISLLALFGGCATLPPPEKMKAEVENFKLPVLPEAGKALVYVVRPSGLGGLIRFNVFVDDQESESEMGYTRSSQYIYFNVTPGLHKIFSKAENWADVVINVQPNEILFLEQDPNMGFIMARNNIYQIADYEGKFHLKTLELGTIIKTEKFQKPQPSVTAK